jgi:hypothetical protein
LTPEDEKKKGAWICRAGLIMRFSPKAILNVYWLKPSLAALPCIILSTVFLLAADAFPKERPKPVYQLDSEKRFRDYTVRTYSEGLGSGSLEIFLKGKRVFRIRQGGTFEIVEIEADRKKHRTSIPLIGKDINGNGIPDLVICEYSGGAHCCFSYYIFEMGKRFKETAYFYMKDSQLNFRDTDRDGKLELFGVDATFANWHACSACSPMPGIALRYQGITYVIAADLMSKPAPPARTLQAKIRKIRTSRDWENGIDEYPPELWGTMLDLIYSGHADMARDFFDKAWPEHIKGKEAFFREFRTTLKSSPFWPGIREMNKGKI